jgi:aspartate/methionine/tyrosine aminotransferase
MTLAAPRLRPAESMIDALRVEAREAPQSGIVGVRTYGAGREGLIPLWVGEGDLPTPGFISDAATRALAAGETFYTWQRGIPELRVALARYHERLYARPFSDDRFYVTGGGMQAVQIAVRMVAGVGDEIVVPSPAWPNFVAAIGVSGATPVPVLMTLKDRAWTLDLEALAAAITPRTRGLFINSPANPTGWTATREELQAILAIARRPSMT